MCFDYSCTRRYHFTIVAGKATPSATAASASSVTPGAATAPVPPGRLLANGDADASTVQLHAIELFHRPLSIRLRFHVDKSKAARAALAIGHDRGGDDFAEHLKGRSQLGLAARERQVTDKCAEPRLRLSGLAGVDTWLHLSRVWNKFHVIR